MNYELRIPHITSPHHFLAQCREVAITATTHYTYRKGSPTNSHSSILGEALRTSVDSYEVVVRTRDDAERHLTGATDDDGTDIERMGSHWGETQRIGLWDYDGSAIRE